MLAAAYVLCHVLLFLIPPTVPWSARKSRESDEPEEAAEIAGVVLEAEGAHGGGGPLGEEAWSCA